MLYKSLTLIVLCGVVLAIGCAEEEVLTESDMLSMPYTVLVDERMEVLPETYQTWELLFLKDEKLHGEVASDPEVGILFLSPKEFAAYENREPFRVHSAASRMRTRAFTFTYTIPETGKYHFVVDNVGSVSTSKVVSVRLTLMQ